jgi:hypothetical protein
VTPAQDNAEDNEGANVQQQLTLIGAAGLSPPLAPPTPHEFASMQAILQLLPEKDRMQALQV